MGKVWEECLLAQLPFILVWFFLVFLGGGFKLAYSTSLKTCCSRLLHSCRRTPDPNSKKDSKTLFVKKQKKKQKKDLISLKKKTVLVLYIKTFGGILMGRGPKIIADVRTKRNDG